MSDPKEIEVTPFERRHVIAAVDVHMRAFPTFFLTFLGRGFLCEFYRAFCGETEGIAFAATDREKGRLIGVVVGPLKPEGFFKRLLRRRWWAFCWHSLFAVCRRPSIAPRLLRAFSYRGDGAARTDRALLSSIAVDPAVQRCGAGRLLVEAFVCAARARGARGVFLTTDRDDNEDVNAFYRRLEWALDSTFVTPEGRLMNRYSIDFDGEA